MKKVMVTGGGGYVGTLLTYQLLKKNYEVIVVDTFWFGNFLTKHKSLTVLKKNILNLKNSDFKNVHSHSLILLNNLGYFKKSLSKMRSICNIDLVKESELCKTEEGIINVGYYVTKFIDRDLDFDLYI
jgi:dTDP-D-glucose 4,6-dehydratase